MNVTKGNLSLNNNITLTLADSMTINKHSNGTVTLDDDATASNGTGTLSGTNVKLVYSGAAQTVGGEFTGPASIYSVTNYFKLSIDHFESETGGRKWRKQIFPRKM